jgi:hypothetical protein
MHWKISADVLSERFDGVTLGVNLLVVVFVGLV